MNPFLRRFGAWAFTILLVHAVAFLLVRGARGGPLDSARELSPQVRAALESHYHLDAPLAEQYARALGGLLQGDLGPSMHYRGTGVSQVLAAGLPVSLTLGAGGILVALLFGIVAGLGAARRPGGVVDWAVRSGASLVMGIPNFILAGLGVAFFSFFLGWLPSAGSGGPAHFILPSLALGLPFAGQLSRLVRTRGLEVLAGDAVRAAKARGLSEFHILRFHVLPRTLVPVAAFLGPAAAGMLTGSLVVEQVFALPGIGTHFVQAALNRDYTLALGATVLYTALLGAATWASDIWMARLDPRLGSR